MNPCAGVSVTLWVTGSTVAVTFSGALENVAPTMLKILGIEQPAEMTAESLL